MAAVTLILTVFESYAPSLSSVVLPHPEIICSPVEEFCLASSLFYFWLLEQSLPVNKYLWYK